MNESVISTDGLSRSFGRKIALDDISLSISKGTVCSILGPNGAGKTTLLRLLYGLIHPTAGNCSIANDNQIPRSRQTLQSSGCLIDGLEPPGYSRIHQLIALCDSLESDFDKPRAFRLLAEKNLDLHSRWGTLSKGQKRWTALVLLLCRNCNLLLLDEPADGLDPETRSKLYQMIRTEANDRNIAVLVVTHIINDIEKITDDVCILRDGKLLMHEPLEDLREQVFAIESTGDLELPEDVQILKRTEGVTFCVWVRDILGVLSGVVLPGETRRLSVNLAGIYSLFTNEHSDCMP